MAYIAGAFTATLGGSTLGEASDGFTIEHFVNKQLVTGDNQGDTPQDAVFRGHEVFVEVTLNEWNAAGVASAIWPYHATRGAQGTVGVFDIGGSKTASLVLTATSGTSAAGLSSEALFTATRAILAEGFPVRVLLAPRLRSIPLRFRLYQAATGEFYSWSVIS